MTIQQLRYIVGISESGSINKASEVLYVSQPSLTSSVQELEKELKMRIFIRSGRGVVLTPEGADLVRYARSVLADFEALQNRFGDPARRKIKFGVSTQHYSFAVKAFVDLVNEYGMEKYEFAVRETRTREVISDIAALKSEIGVLYLCDFNRAAITRLLEASDLEFHHLVNCGASVYLWSGHPLAKQQTIKFSELKPFPCLSFEQGDSDSFYFAEEILSTEDYPRTIKANDRATMLNLMIGLNGYTLCSGIISRELNGSDFVTVPLEAGSSAPYSEMDIGYICRKGRPLSDIGSRYIDIVRRELPGYSLE